MSEPRILVVDDEPFNLEIVGEYLDGMGFDLVYAESGTEAWEVLTRAGEHFDLILLDRMMPGLDGISVLRQVSENPQIDLEKLRTRHLQNNRLDMTQIGRAHV